MNRYGKQRTVAFVLAFFLVLGLVFPAELLARRPAAPQTSLVRTGTMIIEAKTENAVISGERHFIVTDATSIIDTNGSPIRLADLPVPAKVWMRYTLRMDEDPVCLRIELKQ